MGVMAGKTLLFRFESLVFHRRIGNFLLFVLMTGITKIPGTLGRKRVLVVAAVRIVAGNACLFHRSMDKFLALHHVGLVGVAVETEIISLSHEKFGILALMAGMAGATSAHSSRSVDIFATDHRTLVTEQAEICPFSPKLKLVGRLMGIMATTTFPLFYRLVGRRKIGCGIMTLTTKLTDIGNRLEGMFAGRNMAERALTTGYRAMNKLFFSHGCMTICRNA